jgi:hypothetical protein
MRRIKALSPHIFRIVATAQHILVAQNPELVRDLLTRPYTNLGFNVIGLGGTSTVLELGDEVMKVLWATRHQSAQEQQNALCELGSDQNILINSLGDFALTQSFNIEPYPIKPRHNVIISRQPLVPSFGALPIHDTERLAGLDGALKSQLSEFTTQSLEMADRDGCVPDLAGDNNIGIDQDNAHLVLVDTLPKFSDRESDVYELSVRYLQQVAHAVSKKRYT